MRRMHIHSLGPGLNDPNAACHSFAGQVPQVGNETMGTAQVFVIFWSDYYFAAPTKFRTVLVRLYVKKLVLKNFAEASADQLLERMIDLSL